jgi:uncharacterized membrane protein
MNQPSPAQGLRERLPLAPQREEYFRWRGNEISRVEGFTDAVFAFAVTLLVVALEGPHDYIGLRNVLCGFPAFVCCFALLMTFWNAHFRYQRRYGLEDVFTRIMTMGILVLVLFFVYPLKFLFTMVTVNIFGLPLEHAPHLDSREQVQVLYLVYGLGFAGIWGIYAVMYGHALRKRDVLGLSEAEIIQTRQSLVENLIYVAVCGLSIGLAYSISDLSVPGYIYTLLGPLQAGCGFYFARKVRALVKAG